MTTYIVIKSNTNGVVKAKIEAENPKDATTKAFKAVGYRPSCRDKYNFISIDDENGNEVAYFRRDMFGGGKWKKGKFYHE